MLILPPWYFANSTDSFPATPATTPGVNFTAGASSTDSTDVGVLSALAHDVHYLVIGIGGISSTSANGQCLLDVLIDRAGGTSWSVLIDDLVCGMTAIPGNTTIGFGCYYHFPIWIPAGSAIGVHAKTRHTSDITSGRVIMFAKGNPSRPDMWWCGQNVETLGNGANSQGTNFTPGNSGAAGSWTSIGSTTSGRYGALQFGINGSDATAAAQVYHCEVGVGSQPVPGSHIVFRTLSTSEVGHHDGMISPIWCDIPEGSQMQVRGTCNGTAEVLNACVYGVY